jgi:peptidyl-dipeptidase Dcp
MGPLLDPWTGAHGGFPLFDLINVADFKPALLKSMDLKRAEIEAIVNNKRRPTFANTIARMEDSGRPLERARMLFFIYTSTMNDATMQAIDEEMSPIFAQFADEEVQNEGLFRRIKAVYDALERSRLTPGQKRLTEKYYSHFARQGAAVDGEKQARLREINALLATLYTTFSNNLLAEEEGYFLVLESEDDLAGLPESVRQSAAAEAKERGMPDKYVISNTRSSMEPFLTFSSRRDLREKGWRMWTMRGDNNDARDNKTIIGEILKLRSERAQILGYDTHAHWVIADNMAGTPENAMDLMLKLWGPAVARVHEEVAEMQAIADREPDKITIQPWDYRFYAELVRKEKFDIDQDLVKQYLQLDRIREGMFWAAQQVFGIEMVKVEDIPVVHPDVTVYEVWCDGRQIGLWYFDPYARTGKRSGAWMEQHRSQENFRRRITPIVSNNSNFVKGEPILISLDDAQTLFHESGHDLHALKSNVKYPSQAGTSVKRDFVEFPSQVFERWLMTREVLSRFALHYETGEAMPEELITKLEAAKTFNQGFLTVELLAAALYDMKIHLAATPNQTIDPEAFERQTMAEIGCPKEIVMRHRPTQFGHIFSGDGYSAGYYVYPWAEAMAADAAEAFAEAGFYDRATCDRFAATIFSVGDSVAPDQAFINFRGRPVDTNALMRDRGFPVA